RDTQGVASLALGYVLHWAFSPPLLNPKLKSFIKKNALMGARRSEAAENTPTRDVAAENAPTRDASPPLELAFVGSIWCLKKRKH
ncbi:hypothetical protein, partial [Prevotellamassilia timonensis]|uniref:hypothetical protein n=1 Tax=Prevotellamassilia timonensis TaxID=1852370 RepID=UPI004028FF6A